MSDASEVTQLLASLNGGDPEARDRLFPLVFRELKTLARHIASDPRATLQPTALVDDVFMKLVGSAGMPWSGRRHFFSVAAKAMRQLVVDHARERAAAKRGGEWERVTLEGVGLAEARAPIDGLELDAALARLAGLDARQAEVVELRIFGGLSVEDVARTLDVSETTVKVAWRGAKAWLRRELARGSGL